MIISVWFLSEGKLKLVCDITCKIPKSRSATIRGGATIRGYTVIHFDKGVASFSLFFQYQKYQNCSVSKMDIHTHCKLFFFSGQLRCDRSQDGKQI